MHLYKGFHRGSPALKLTGTPALPREGVALGVLGQGGTREPVERVRIRPPARPTGRRVLFTRRGNPPQGARPCPAPRSATS
ncbi:TPA: hypothetical protein EYP38_01585 [Candidatus Micrarchaeota archaeon]|nr:hypothetical protein [Candidatus Micrarchaeota archaeon]